MHRSDMFAFCIRTARSYSCVVVDNIYAMHVFGMTKVTTDTIDTTDYNDRPVARSVVSVIMLLVVPILVNNNGQKFIFY